MNIPKDPHILLSYINTKLRDNYPSLDELCNDLSIDRIHLETELSSIHYTYAQESNRFIAE